MVTPPRRSLLREVGLVALASCVLAVVVTWPLAAHLTTHVPDNTQDPSLIAWQIAWAGHALFGSDPVFSANAFWPLRDSLAFSDALLGYAPAGLIGSGPEAAIVRHNLLHLFAQALAFGGAYALARALGAKPAGSAVAGVAFAYAPWRLGQVVHLHVLSSGALPLSLALLVWGYRRRSAGLVLGGWLVATWQVAIGFTIGLQLAYLLAALAAVAAVVWARRGRPRPPRRILAATAAGIAVMGGWSAIQAQPYLRVADRHPEAERTLAEVRFYSPPVAGLLAAPPGNDLWGGVGERLLDEDPVNTEHAIFPGAVLLALAAIGLAAGAWPRRLRGGLAAGAVAAAVLSLGPRLGEAAPYRLLYEFAPGWEGIRTPGRLVTLTTLALALLAAAGSDRLVAAATRRRAIAGTAAAAALALAVLGEGWGDRPLARVPELPAEAVAAPAPQLHLPSTVVSDSLFMLASTDGFRPLVNGYSGFTPARLEEVRRAARGFPDRRSVAGLRELGVRTVVVHRPLDLRRLATRTPQEEFYAERAEREREALVAAATRPVAGLDVERRDIGSAVLFDLR